MASDANDPLSTEKDSSRNRSRRSARKHSNHQALRNPAWSIYGAQRAQPVATGGKWDTLENGSKKPIGNPWQPTATVPERMVRRGSTVRVRQRALQRRRTWAPSRSDRLAESAACGGYGSVHGAFALAGRLTPSAS